MDQKVDPFDRLGETPGDELPALFELLGPQGFDDVVRKIETLQALQSLNEVAKFNPDFAREVADKIRGLPVEESTPKA